MSGPGGSTNATGGGSTGRARRRLTAMCQHQKCAIDAPPSKTRDSAQGEPGQAGGPGQGAVDGEWCQGAGFKVPGEITDGEVGANKRGDAPAPTLPADPGSQWPEQLWDFVYPSGQNYRRRQQEREAGGVFVGQAAPQAGHDGDAGAADTRQQRQDLSGADQHTPGHGQLGEPIVDCLAAVCGLIVGWGGRVRGTRTAAEDLGRVQGDAVEDQECGRRNGFAQRGAE